MRRGAAWYDADTASGTDKPAAVHFTSREERIYSMPLKTRLAPKEHMGLTTWENALNGKILKTDVTVAKNYLSEQEMHYLERIVSLYLDYAEALNEAEGPVDDVYKYVDAIRKRAGLPGLAKGLDKDKMRIQHERQIELAFEAGHRYFDCHRWKIAEKTDDGYMHGMNITATNKVDYSKRSTVGDSRVFEKKHYLFPIPQSEMDKRIGLVQSPYWE